MTILEYCAVQVPSTSPGARLVCAGEAEAYDKKEEPAGMQCRRALLFVIHYVIQSVLLAGPAVQLPSPPCFLETCRQERFLSLSAQAATHAKYWVLWCADERVHLVSQAFLRINLVLVDGAHHLPQVIYRHVACANGDELMDTRWEHVHCSLFEDLKQLALDLLREHQRCPVAALLVAHDDRLRLIAAVRQGELPEYGERKRVLRPGEML